MLRFIGPVLLALISVVPTLSAQSLELIDARGMWSFGWSVARHGDTVVVGEPYNGLGYRAHVFQEDLGRWTKVTTLQPIQGSRAGEAVAIFDDTIFVGNPGQTKVEVFRKSGGQWTKVQTILDPEGYDKSEFGQAIAVSGQDLFIGAPYSGETTGEHGAVYHFVELNGTWSLSSQLSLPQPQTPSTVPTPMRFGEFLAFDDGVLVVAAPSWNDGTMRWGAIAVFDRTASGWAQSAVFTDLTLEPYMRFGWGGVDVVVSQGRTTIIVGSHAGSFRTSGRAMIAERENGLWTRQDLRIPTSPVARIWPDTRVGLADDLALVSEIGRGILVFRRYGTGWFLQQQLLGATTSPWNRGRRIAMDGRSAVISSVGTIHALDDIPDFGGTLDGLSLMSRVNGSQIVGPDVHARVGDSYEIRLRSRGLTVPTDPILVAQIHRASQPPRPAFPGIAIDLLGQFSPMIITRPQANTSSSVPAWSQTPDLLFATLVPPALSGLNVLFQAYVPDSSAANGIFASSTGHVLNVQP